MGLPYALSSDLVSAYPAKSLSIAEYVDGQIPLLAMTQNAQTGVSYSFVLTDFTKLVTTSNASAVAVTLPLESSVAWPAGTQLRILNIGAGTVTVAGAAGVTINGTPLTLAQFKAATLVKTGTNTWSFLPFTSGVGAAVYSDANTGTYTGYAYKTYSASGTLSVTQAGFADIVLVGGGGGGDNGEGGGGAGGVLTVTNAYLPVGTLTVTIGAGGTGGADTASSPGSASRLDSYYALGGGTALFGTRGLTINNAGSGAGGSRSIASGQAGTPGQGNAGGTGTALNASPYGSGGGGGAGGVGANGSGGTGGNGGAGTTSSIAGTTPTGAYVAGNYAFGGGGGGRGTAGGGTGGSGGGGNGAATTGATGGSANTGGGAGSGNTAAPNGGSGILIVRVAV